MFKFCDHRESFKVLNADTENAKSQGIHVECGMIFRCYLDVLLERSFAEHQRV